MALKDDIIKKAKEILDGAFTVTDVTTVPSISDSRLTFGNTGLRFEATVLYIDMRGSTGILHKHNRTTVSKIHMVYFHTVVKIAQSFGGEVRSFNGDSLLVFFQGTTKASLSDAVAAALQIRYIITNELNGLLSKYSALNFGIGLDHGHILCTKVGVGGNSNNQDLFWVGKAVNKAVVISDECNSPYFIGISSYVYANLEDHVKTGGDSNNMWSAYYVTYNENQELFYKTHYMTQM